MGNITMSNVTKPIALVLEDNKENLKLKTNLFQAGGFNVIGASSLGKAVEKIHDEAVDIVITDINLDPNRNADKSGLHFAKFVKNIKPGVPIVGYSGYYSSSDFDAQQIAIFDYYQAKGDSTATQLIENITRCRDLAYQGRLLRQKQSAYDVFLSYNNHDKKTVRRLAKSLKNRDLKVWFDEWELPPGRVWQEFLEEALINTKSAIVALGKDGAGPWENQEMRVLLSEYIKRGLPVIPVLLPGTGSKPEFPLFLQQFTWVDLRAGIRKKAMDHLHWGITGKKPEQKMS